MDIIDDEESDERDQIVEIEEDNLESEESESYERYKIESPQLLKLIDIQQNRDNDDPVDTDIELEINVVKTHIIK